MSGHGLPHRLASDAGTVQPHALLWVLDDSGRRILGASTNSAERLGGPDVPLGRRLAGLLDAGACARIAAAIDARIDADRCAAIASLGALAAADGHVLGDARLHRSEGRWLLEIEDPVGGDADLPLGLLQDALEAPAHEGLAALLERTVAQLRALSGFDRVFAYRIDADGTCERIAGSWRAGLPDAGGGQADDACMSTPAGDPTEPGSMFALADLGAVPVPIALLDEGPEAPATAPDLGCVGSRGVPAAIARTLRDAGVRASLALTLAFAGRSWGRIVCHHLSGPRRISTPRRIALVAAAQAASHRIAAIDAAAQQRRRDRMRERIASAVAALGSSDEFGSVLLRHADALMDGFGAGGMAVSIGQTLERRGRTPPEAALRELAQWLTVDRPAVFATERIGALFAPLAAHADRAAGLLAIRVSRVSADFVMWFRPRANRAGQHASLPWRPEEREAANELRRAALDVLVERSLRVGRRASSLSRDNEALVSADRRKDAFIAMLGHELRTPLAALEYGLATLERAQADGRTAPEALALISRQTRQMGALVDDIVDIARIRHNRLALRRRRLRVAEIVRHAVEATAAAFERAGQTVTVSADPTLTVMADPVRLTQILTNLIVNALRHGASARPIEIHARPERGFAAIDVRDHGAGIAPALQRTIFEAFSAPAAEHGSANTGLGLGLALVRRLVESHGGSIAVASEPGRGACFTVRLPRLDDAPAAGGGAPTRPASVPARSRRVLVVDDDPDAAVSLAMLLRAYGHEARKAQDGETALSVLTRFDADIVTIDLGLPDIDGASLAREIRARVATPVLIVCISGELPESGVDADAFDHLLMKPARPEQLFSIIDGFD